MSFCHTRSYEIGKKQKQTENCYRYKNYAQCILILYKYNNLNTIKNRIRLCIRIYLPRYEYIFSQELVFHWFLDIDFFSLNFASCSKPKTNTFHLKKL